MIEYTVGAYRKEAHGGEARFREYRSFVCVLWWWWWWRRLRGGRCSIRNDVSFYCKEWNTLYSDCERLERKTNEARIIIRWLGIPSIHQIQCCINVPISSLTTLHYCLKQAKPNQASFIHPVLFVKQHSLVVLLLFFFFFLFIFCTVTEYILCKLKLSQRISPLVFTATLLFHCLLAQSFPSSFFTTCLLNVHKT